MMLALEWADTVHRPRKLTHDPRKARPDAVNLPPDVRAKLHAGPQGKRRDGAPEGAPAPGWAGHLRAGLSGDGLDREASHGCARPHTSVSLRSISPHLFGDDERERGATRAPVQAGREALAVLHPRTLLLAHSALPTAPSGPI